MLKEVVHFVAALQFTYAVYYDWNYVKIPSTTRNIGQEFGGKFKFLTFWDAIIQCVFFWICLINDFWGSNGINPNPKSFIRNLKDNLFCCIAFPISAFVCITFWTLYAIDRELIFPASMEPHFPNWLNHIMHTNIFIFTIIEFVTSFRMYPTKKTGLTTLSIFILVYFFWILIVYSNSGYWVYPVLEVLNWPLRILFFISMKTFTCLIYIVQEKLNKKIWYSEMMNFYQNDEDERKRMN